MTNEEDLPPQPRGRMLLPEPETIDDLSRWLHAAVELPDSVEGRAGKVKLLASLRSLDDRVCALAMHALDVLGWCRKHPGAPIPLLPGERPRSRDEFQDPDQHALMMSHWVRRLAELDSEAERRQLERADDHSAGNNPVLGGPAF